MRIFSIIVTFNGMKSDWIQKCLDSLLVSSVKTEIIVIDNGSLDGTVEFIQKNYPQVDLIVVNENLGFAKANNIGIRKAYDKGADYFFLLNQDAWVEKNTIEKLVEVFEQLPEAGIVSPVHLNGSKTGLDFDFINCLEQNIISDLYFDQLKEYYETNFVNAAAWLISRKCIETIGGFDTLMFYHYGEDNNYCNRVHYHGLKLYIATTTTICHDRGERKDSFSEAHLKRQTEVWQCSYYANIEKDDEIINVLKAKLSLLYIIKRILKLQVKTLLTQWTTDKRFYTNIKKSREQNKKNGLNWL